MKRHIPKKKSAQRSDTTRELDRIWKQVSAQVRRDHVKEQAERDRQVRQLLKDAKARARKLPKRNLSQITFLHWWKDRAFVQRLTENQIPIEEQKAAVWYEAARRRPEVQKAWFEGKHLFGVNDWQNFTTWVLLNLPLSWPDLDPITKGGVIEASYSPWSLPPEGYSTFPTDKSEQKKVSMQVLRLPEPNDPVAAQRFVDRARLFADTGFLIVAVDKKQNQAVRAACEAIEALPPTFRKADLKQVMAHHLPPDISDADQQALEEKQRQGTLKPHDFDELWHKYIKPTNNPFAPWHQTATFQERVLHKRQRQGKFIEEKQFNFESICRQLEAFDNGTISDFVKAVRL